MGPCIIFWILLIFGSHLWTVCPISLTVHTRNFDIQGTLKGTIRGKYAYAYLGVPYARPPIGQLRYKPPQPITRWQGSKNGTQLAKTCYSSVDRTFPGFPGSEMWNPPTELTEDCLNLNIWVPAGVDVTSEKLPVVVWIFGGGFYSGSPSLDLYDGAILATENDLIVVNINYRLGPFGFLYLGKESSAEGNMGLLDQQMALKWIKENIGAFGGDAEDVTLFGESAGAASVSAHLLAPGSSHLFRRAMLQSGTVINEWAHVAPEVMLRRSKRLADLLGCNIEKPEADIASCLRGKTAGEIQAASDRMNGNEARFLEFSFVPINVDGAFFVENVTISLKRGNFKKCPVIIGLVSEESTFWLPYYLPGIIKFYPNRPKNEQKSLLTRSEYLEAVNVTFRDYFPSILGKSIAFHYSDNLKIAAEGRHEASFRNSVSRLVSDYFFDCDVIRFAEILANHSTEVYFYKFTQRSTANPWPLWMGTMHGYEIEFFFGVPLRKESEYTEMEREFSKEIMTLWATFAKDGFSSLGQVKSWPPYTLHDKKYLILSAEDDRVLSHVHNKNCKFWTDVRNANRRLICEPSDTTVDHKESLRAYRNRFHFSVEPWLGWDSSSSFMLQLVMVCYLICCIYNLMSKICDMYTFSIVPVPFIQQAM